MKIIAANISELEYHKIDTLFERDRTTFVVNPNQIKSEVLCTINPWEVTEKIDGMNIRVILSEHGEITFGGRSNAAQLPTDLFQYLIATFQPELMKAALWKDGPADVILFGEGYGAGIQKGGSYRNDKAFILFDVLVGGKWWLERAAVGEIASKLGIEAVPVLGRMGLPEIVKLVESGFASAIGSAKAEGIVARPIETLFDRRGERIIIKLKTRDFVSGKR